MLSGKSVFAQIALIYYLFKPKTFNGYISPSFKLGQKVYRELTRLLEPTKQIKSSNASTLTIEMNNGSILQFFSAEAPTSIRGFTISGLLVIDEAAYIPEQTTQGENIYSNVILPITKARCKKVIVISTPRGKQGFFYNLYLKGKEEKKGYKLIEANIYKDELIDNQMIEELKQSMPELAFRQEFECQFIDSALTFFNNFENCQDDGMLYNDNSRQWIGVDLSGDGNDETILTKINDENQVVQYKIKGTLDSKYKQISNIINETNNLQSCYIENNGIGSPMINEIRKLVKYKSKIEEFHTTNSSKEEIISNLAVKIANGDIKYDDNELYSQFATFVVKLSKTKKYIFEAQNGYHDDRIMSLAIALKSKEDNRTSIIPKVKLNLQSRYR